MGKSAKALRTARSVASAAIVLVVGLVAGGGTAWATGTSTSSEASADPVVARGAWLATAADCIACHTAPSGGAPYAGGNAIHSPVGTIWSTNITPSRKDGIGNYTEAQFARALREGVRADGERLYPAMPYTSYTLLSDADVHALYRYFMSGVKPVDVPAPRTKLAFPFGVRGAMAGWDLLFNRSGRFVSDPHKSVEWNRGAYLVNALAHCSSCHTPRNVLFAEDVDRRFAGAHVDGWYAPPITADLRTGIGAWTTTQLVDYLQTGDVPHRALVAGPMADAIDHSFAKLDRADLSAIATYLLDGIPTPSASSAAQASGSAAAERDEATLRGVSRAAQPSGAQLYSGNCAACHQIDGNGTRDGDAPSLIAISDVQRDDPDNLIMAILHGVDREGARPRLMPAFANEMNDQEVATLVNYVRERFGTGTHATPVSSEAVHRLRSAAN